MITGFGAAELEWFDSGSFKLSLLKLLYMVPSWSANVTCQHNTKYHIYPVYLDFD